jgi:hypothetical protein
MSNSDKKETPSKKRERDDTSSEYDLPGYDIRNANELADTSRNVRLKKEYTGTNVAAPASQLDAFEFYGGKSRRSRRRNSHKKRSHHRRRHNKTKRGRHGRRR